MSNCVTPSKALDNTTFQAALEILESVVLHRFAIYFILPVSLIAFIIDVLNCAFFNAGVDRTFGDTWLCRHAEVV